MSTEDIDVLTREYLKEHNAHSADLNYEGYPKSICTSINDVVCHGIPSSDVILKDGDIINVDATSELNGYYADASRMFMMGNVSDEAKKLVKITKEAMYEGMKANQSHGKVILEISVKQFKDMHILMAIASLNEFCGSWYWNDHA